MPSLSLDPNLVPVLANTPHEFLQPSASLHLAAVSLAKNYLDPVAASVSDIQHDRRNESRKKRKRRDTDYRDDEVLQLRKIHIDGFAVDQVWEQMRRVFQAARKEVEIGINVVNGSSAPSKPLLAVTNGHTPTANGIQPIRFDEEGFEVGSSDEDEELDDEEALEDEDGSLSDEEFPEEEDLLSEEDDGENIEDDYDEDDQRIENDEDALSVDEEAAETYVEDRFGLNDGFFSIDDFNKQSEFLEQIDARGDPNDGAASDEEEVDWDIDPMAAGSTTTLNASSTKKQNVVDEDDEDEDEDDEDGPTFGNADLNAPEGDSEDDFDDDEEVEEGDLDGVGMSNANNVMYSDFFAPPARKTNKNKKGRPNPHNFPQDGATRASKAQEDDIERTMSAVHRDLFEDDDPEDESDQLSDVDPADPKSRRSNHERRQAKLLEEIRKLEAANVAKRQWTLSGEARAADRPMNSLLEEDLEFERSGKPVPVITAEITEDIEALIKRRIVADEFDGVAPRRPDDLATGLPKRGRVELDDTKPQQSLAEMYEEEHLRKTDPNFVDSRDEKLKKEHREIEAMWKDVCGKLDALSSWHYKPKPAAPNLDIRVDAATITIEDARPSTGGEVATNMLAPQEIYASGEAKDKSEIVTKGGLPIAREELSREEKLRRRRREKERIKKSGGDTNKKESQRTKEQKNVVDSLKKGGVKIIDRKGDIKTIDGKTPKVTGVKKGGASFKL